MKEIVTISRHWNNPNIQENSMPYDHYLFDMPDMGDALEQINDNHEKIIAAFYLTDSNQVCLVTFNDNINVDKALKNLFEKRDEQREVNMDELGYRTLLTVLGSAANPS